MINFTPPRTDCFLLRVISTVMNILVTKKTEMKKKISKKKKTARMKKEAKMIIIYDDINLSTT